MKVNLKAKTENLKRLGEVVSGLEEKIQTLTKRNQE